MQTDKLNRTRDSVNDSSRSFRAFYISFIAIFFYALVIISSTDHELLFRSGNVTMPLINVSIPIVWFFTVTPLILLLLHLNLLIQSALLSAKLSQYATALKESSLQPNEQQEERLLIFPVPIAHVLAKSVPTKDTHLLLHTFVITSVVFLPIFSIAYLLVQFLPYQSEPITWFHRILLLADLTILWLFWPRVVSPHSSRLEWWRSRRARHYLMLLCSVLLLVVSMLVTTSPGSIIDKHLALYGLRDIFQRHFQLSERILVLKEPSPSILSSLLTQCRISNPNVFAECDRVIAPGSRLWCRHAQGLALQGRQFRGANLSGSILCDAGMEGADFSEAHLDRAILYGANFSSALLNKASLSSAILNDAIFSGADLTRANLAWARVTAQVPHQL